MRLVQVRCTIAAARCSHSELTLNDITAADDYKHELVARRVNSGSGRITGYTEVMPVRGDDRGQNVGTRWEQLLPNTMQNRDARHR